MVNCIFSYGTLRMDSTKTGDDWGVFNNSNYKYKYGKLYGYKLYQHKCTPYPFITPTYNNNDFVIGTYIYGLNDIDFDMKLIECDLIEGYNKDNLEESLYKRAVGKIELLDETNNKYYESAYFYYQDYSKQNIEDYKLYKKGDWFINREEYKPKY